MTVQRTVASGVTAGTVTPCAFCAYIWTAQNRVLCSDLLALHSYNHAFCKEWNLNWVLNWVFLWTLSGFFSSYMQVLQNCLKVSVWDGLHFFMLCAVFCCKLKWYQPKMTSLLCNVPLRKKGWWGKSCLKGRGFVAIVFSSSMSKKHFVAKIRNLMQVI